MGYRKDKDLEFLQYCDTEDLQVLVDYLTKDKDGRFRFTEELTNTENYKKYYPDRLPRMWQDIAEELQKFGGNSVMNVFRQEGVLYREILIDVAKNQKVIFDERASVDAIEKNILDALFEKTIQKMSIEEQKVFLRGLGGNSLSVGVAKGLVIQTLVVSLIWSGLSAIAAAAPAYRVTIPSVIQIACMRMKYNASKEKN